MIASRDEKLFCAIMIALSAMIVTIPCYADSGWIQEINGHLDNRMVPLYWLGSSRPSLCFGDLDTDGDADLLVGSTYWIALFRNDGTKADPHFTLVTEDLLNTGVASADYYYSPTLGDLDGDGDLDMLVGTNTASGGAGLEFYRNTGTTTSASWTKQSISLPSGGMHTRPCLTDFNGDGLLDLAMGAGSLQFFENTGTPNDPILTTSSIVSVSPEANPGLSLTYSCCPDFCDVDGDGDQDMFVGFVRDDGWPGGFFLWFYRNIGDAQHPDYERDDALLSGLGHQNTSLWASASVDIDADGDSDLFAAEQSGRIHFFQNVGNSYSPQFNFVPRYFLLDAVSLSKPDLCDLDDDGDLDMLVGGNLGRFTDHLAATIFQYENVGTPLAPRWKLITERYGDIVLSDSHFAELALHPTFADFDGDGLEELFVTQGGGGKIEEYRNTGTRKNPQWTKITPQFGGIQVGTGGYPGYKIAYIDFVDLNADKDLDLILGESSGAGSTDSPKVWYYENVGGSLSSGLEIVNTNGTNGIVSPGGSWIIVGPALVDIDHDGDYDLLLGVSGHSGAFSEGQINYFENIGTREAFDFVRRNANYIDGSNMHFYDIPVDADINGDGNKDLFIGGMWGGMRCYINDGNNLDISPESSTVLALNSILLNTGESVFDATWSLFADRSGASLIPSGTACQYIAGATADVIDVIEVRDASGTIGRAYINVISAEEIGRAGKAVIVAGWKGTGDPLWPDTARSTTNYLANFAYRTLLHRGFSKENVYYLSPDPAQDVDGDGANNDIDAESTLLNVQYALSDWAGQAPAPAKLLVYLVDHGGEQGAGQGYLRLNPGEVLLAQTTDAWLDALQVAHPELEVTLAVDACRSGSFLDECVAPSGLNRVALASAMDSQDAFFSAGGAISFSEAFFNSVYTGLSVGQSFSNASGAMDRYQTAWLDDTGDGVWGKDDDGAAADARVIGATFIAGADRPQIGKINANQSISSGTSALLWASDVASVYPIDEVFAVIVPPSFLPNPDDDPEQPVTELPRLELTWNPSASRYEGTCNNFTETGAYKVVLYARDIWDSLSYPKQTYVNQLGSTEKVVIVAGDTAFNAYSPWEYSNALANYAYRTCLDRWIGKERIRYFNGQTSQDADGNGAADDVYASPGLAGLSDTMTGWASDALSLTVYLVGEMGEDRFQLNGAEALYSDQLASWLDILSASGVERITIVLEGDASGSFVDDLEGAGRNVIASCSAGGLALNQVGGMLSFSQFFWNKVLNGINVRDSFQFGRQAMRFVTSYAQQAAIQDGAGGALAVQTWIGAAFVTGEEAPMIGAVSEDVFYATGEAAILWASQVSDPDGIARVWALVVPPDYDPAPPALDLIDEVPLAYNASQARYEAALGSLERIGQYRVTFFAEDRQGNLSAPTQTTLLYGMDAYEEDDTMEKAAMLYVNASAQYHNFHDAGDADWVKFYLFGGRGYSLEANNLEDRCDVVLNFRDSLGQLIAQVNDWSGNVAEAIPYNASATDAYYLEVIHASGEICGASTGYELDVRDTGGPHNGLATSIGGRSAMCSWDAAPGARGYHLYRSLSDPDGPFVRVNASEIAATSYLDEGLEPETLYFYYVKKVEMDGTETDWTGVFYVLTGKEETDVIRWELY